MNLLMLSVEIEISISSELIDDCNFQSSMNDNEMNFQYLEHLDYEEVVIQENTSSK